MRGECYTSHHWTGSNQWLPSVESRPWTTGLSPGLTAFNAHGTRVKHQAQGRPPGL